MHTRPRTLANHPLRTLSTSAAVLLAFASCAAPHDTTGTAAEPLALTPVREAFVDVHAIEQFVQDNVPRWTAYVNGRDFYYGTGGASSGVKQFYSTPVDRDQFYKLVLVPEGSEAKPETWLFLDSVELWMKGDAYLTEEIHLSLLDAIGIAIALDTAGAEPPLLPGLSSSGESPPAGNHVEDEEGYPGSMPPPEEGGGDDHTWTGGPPTFGRAPRQGSGGPPGGGGTVPSGHSRWRPRPPSFGEGNPAEDVENGVGPNDRPVGKYPGWDKPHGPQETWETFRCRGAVYEGYKSDCPDFQPLPPGELWVMPFDQVVQKAAENAQHNMHMLRTDPDCMDACLGAVAIPVILASACGGLRFEGAPSVYAAAWQAFCAVFQFVKDPTFVGGTAGASVIGPYWCQTRFCMPPSGTAKE